mgnify:CR=1 FL=1
MKRMGFILPTMSWLKLTQNCSFIGATINIENHHIKSQLSLVHTLQHKRVFIKAQHHVSLYTNDCRFLLGTKLSLCLLQFVWFDLVTCVQNILSHCLQFTVWYHYSFSTHTVDSHGSRAGIKIPRRFTGPRGWKNRDLKKVKSFIMFR